MQPKIMIDSRRAFNDIVESRLLYRGAKRNDLSKKTSRISFGKVPLIRFSIYEDHPDLTAVFTTRLGGVSEDIYSSMNLSFHRGDDPEAVRENYRRLGAALDIDETRMVFSDQVHQTAIRVVTKNDCGKGITRKSDITETDGLMTDVPGIPLVTFFADCVPLYIYDPKRPAIALLHSGWKGTVSDIGGEGVRKMRETYGSDPANLLCAIGPSICVSCYEVSEDVAERFASRYTEDELQTILSAKGEGKYMLDLHEAVKANFLRAGVSPEHILMPDLCTCCNPEFLFSHRASHGKRGNLAAVMMLHEKA